MILKHLLFRGLPALIVALMLLGTPTLAQTGNGAKPDYDAWQTLATRIEDAVEAGRASDTVLENLRNDLTSWRADFVGAKDLNVRTIAAVQAQISALGPAPETGLEPDEIAAQRETLNARLAELEAPRKRAEVAQSRADALIGEIDRILSERQTNAFVSDSILN